MLFENCFLTILQKSSLSAQSVLIATMVSPLSKAALISLPPFCTLQSEMSLPNVSRMRILPICLHVAAQCLADADSTNLLACLTTGNLSDYINFKVYILTYEPAANVDV